MKNMRGSIRELSALVNRLQLKDRVKMGVGSILEGQIVEEYTSGLIHRFLIKDITQNFWSAKSQIQAITNGSLN